MPLFRDLPIRRKLTWVNVVTTAAALLVVSAAFVTYDLFILRQRLVRQLSTEAEIVGYNAASALLFRDGDAATKTLTALRAQPQVVAAGVFTPDGQPFATYLRKGQSIAPDLRLAERGNGHRFLDDHLLVFRNIDVEGETIGSVRMLSDLAELTTSVLRHLGIAAIVFLAAIAATFPVLARLWRVISGPIMDLVHKARIVSEQKDYSVRAIPASNDELGLLVRAFNDMLEQIQKRDQDLERARDDAEKANRAKDEFLAIVSHELRTPLNPVMVWARMLRSGQLDEARTARGLEVIERNVKSQAQLIEDLLDVSRIITGKLRLDVRPIELGPVVEAAVESVRPTAEMKNVRLQLALDPRVTIAGDPERLKQVVWNLLSNAIKFTPKGGRVQVIMQRVNSHVEIAVSDTGKGISAEFLPFVFDRFRQADSSSTRTYGGLGLGLSIVRHLAEFHGGRVRAESPGEDQGATFTVELPISPLHPASAPERRHPTAESHELSPDVPHVLAGLRVLAVDDDPDTLETIRLLFEQGDAVVRTASSVEEALRVLDEWLPDVLISDIGMPHADGYSLIREIRRRGAGRGGEIPAIALTAYARIEDRLEILAAGFQMHVPKPIDPAELIAVVNSVAVWAPRNRRDAFD